jgi:hypothetical protein
MNSNNQSIKAMAISSVSLCLKGESMAKLEAMTSPDGSTEEETRLRTNVDAIVANMLAANVAQKIFETDERIGKEYWVLATPNALEKRFIAVAVLGYPEQVGVWSYTLLGQSRVNKTSMEPYFREFATHDFGFIAINPNFFAPDIEGSSFFYQLDRVVSQITSEKRCGLIGFSMGGAIVLDFLDQRPSIMERVAGMVLIDPTLPSRLRLKNIRPLLDRDTLLIASEGEADSPGEFAASLLNIPAVSFPGIHGEMPNKALSRIIEFYQERID